MDSLIQDIQKALSHYGVNTDVVADIGEIRTYPADCMIATCYYNKLCNKYLSNPDKHELIDQTKSYSVFRSVGYDNTDKANRSYCTIFKRLVLPDALTRYAELYFLLLDDVTVFDKSSSQSSLSRIVLYKDPDNRFVLYVSSPATQTIRIGIRRNYYEALYGKVEYPVEEPAVTG